MRIYTCHQNTEPKSPSLKSSTELERWNRSQHRLVSSGHRLPLNLEVKPKNFALRPKRRAFSCRGDEPSGSHDPPVAAGRSLTGTEGSAGAAGGWVLGDEAKLLLGRCPQTIAPFPSARTGVCVSFPARSPSHLCRSSLPSHQPTLIAGGCDGTKYLITPVLMG